MRIDAVKLAKEVERTFHDVRRSPCVSDESFAILEVANVQVQIVVTQDPHEFLDDVLPGLVEFPTPAPQGELIDNNLRRESDA